MGWSYVRIESICSITDKSIHWTINKSVIYKEKSKGLESFVCFSIGYSIPMFSGFVIMFLSTLSKDLEKFVK